MATAKIQTVKGLRVEIFSLPLRKNTTRPLTVWIVGTDIEQGLLFVIGYGIIFPDANWQILIFGGIIMKKIGICIGLLGLIILIKVLLEAKDKKAASTNIIGGADGVTTIYLAEKHNHKH